MSSMNLSLETKSEQNSPRYNPKLIGLFQKRKITYLREFREICTDYPGETIAEYKILLATHFLATSMILSQVPTMGNFRTFYNLIYDKADAVIMLLQDKDFEYKPEGCFPYHQRQEFGCPEFLVQKSPIENGILNISKLTLTPMSGTALPKSVTHYHYNDWEDGKAANLEHIAHIARKTMEAALPLIHCKAGTGRTGTLAAIITAYRAIKEGNHSSRVVKNSVRVLRAGRPGCIHNFDQYKMIYSVLKILLQEDGLLPT